MNVICPGFVDTPINQGRARRPFLMDAPRAARTMARGLAADRPRIAFPLPMLALVRLMDVLPEALVIRILGTGAGRG